MFRMIVRRLGLIAVAGVVAGAVIWGLWPSPVPVDIGTIGRGDLEVTVEDDGITRIREVYVVSAPTTGKMLRAPREVGDEVVAGETVVAVLQPTEPGFLDARTRRVNEAEVEAARAAVTLADAQVRQTRSQLEFARADLRRASELAQREAISARSLDKAQLDVVSSEAAVASALATLEVRRREVESARARLIQPGQAGQESEACCISVRTPVSGRVLKVVAESEQVVQAGAPLVELGNPADLEIAVDLLSRDAVRVRPGAPARIEGWGGSVTLNARVRRIEPVAFTKVSALGIEEQRVKTVLDFTDPTAAWERLGYGYRVVPRITVWSGSDLLQVPLGALFRSGAGWAVFVVVENRACIRPVEIGERNLHAARVLGGLEAGDRIVLHPSDRIRDGSRVEPRI